MERTLRYDHYKVLGIPRNADPSQVKLAYRTQAKRWHPDREASPGAAEVFIAVQEAYETLIDPQRRRVYDERLRSYRSVPPRNTYPCDAGRNRPRPVDPVGGKDGGDRPVQRFAYVGLHITGLVFGISLITSIVLGVILGLAPVWVAIFVLPGVLAIPASIHGLRH